jgi:membrane-bound lytic murein transglycosylase MltF
MKEISRYFLRSAVLGLVSSAVFILTSCGKTATPPAATTPAASTPTSAPTPETATTPTAAKSPDGIAEPASGMSLPLSMGRRTGDLDEMAKARNIRALVIMNPVGFFYDKGHPQGAMYEALEEFQKFVNQKLKTGTLKVNVSFIPMRPDQVEAALTQGVGDLIAYGVAVTPEREQRVAFSTPIQTNVSQIIVAGPDFGPVTSIADLGGKEVYASPLTTYYDNLLKANEALKSQGKPQIIVKAADKNLTDDDLVQMVNAKLIPATVTTQQKADLWVQVLPNLKAHPEATIATGGQLAWVMRKTNPQLKAMVDEFTAGHAVGTSFGNTVLRRYLKSTKWVTDSTSGAEMKKFQENIALFQKYAGEYDFDYLMLAAQGYQESLLDQSRKNPSGAVGIMQVIPKYAAASPINVSNVSDADGNIHAGAKMMRNLEDKYFNDPNIDRMNKTLFVFASYNAGPGRVAKLRKEAAAMGLNPNVWFNNVEVVAAKDIGQETVTYVANIYKYYVAYTLAVQDKKEKASATGGVVR